MSKNHVHGCWNPRTFGASARDQFVSDGIVTIPDDLPTAENDPPFYVWAVCTWKSVPVPTSAGLVPEPRYGFHRFDTLSSNDIAMLLEDPCVDVFLVAVMPADSNPASQIVFVPGIAVPLNIVTPPECPCGSCTGIALMAPRIGGK